MSFQTRAQWSGDPVDDVIAREERRDHLWAQARGERLAAITDQVISALHGAGQLFDAPRARVITFHVLADHLFGNHAIDLPSTERIPDGPDRS